METRLFYARDIETESSNDSWTILYPEKGGIPVTRFQIEKLDSNKLLLEAGVAEFLTDIIGKGGEYEGW